MLADLLRVLRVPVVAPLIQRPWILRTLAAVALLVVGMNWLSMGLITCPFYAVTHLPCPGCGLTRGCVSTLHGDLGTAIRFHAFAPLVTLLLMGLAAIALLPESQKRRIAVTLTAMEHRSGASAIFLTAFLIYGIVRIVVALLSH